MDSTGTLSGDYIAGFVDGEGCFALKYRMDRKKNRPNSPAYFYWGAEFAIVLREDDGELLEAIHNHLGCGYITTRKGFVRYSIQDIRLLNDKIVPFFSQHKLHGKKRRDFELWAEALNILCRNKRQQINTRKGIRGFLPTVWSEDDLRRLKQIHEEMKPLKSRVRDWKWLK